MTKRSKIKVAVAMSGGVDSSVAAYLLKKQGYSVIGLTMELVPCLSSVALTKEDGKTSCCGIEAIESARQVCQKLKIPHYVLNFKKEFKEKIIDNFCQEYLAGRTPNPCVRCNQFIKFDLLLKKARAIGAEYLATGHYARLRREILNPKSEILNKFKIPNIKLLKGKDKNKDQSYFLYRLTQEQLRYLMFPLGDLTKKQVRQIAKKAKLPVANRPESQEICFVEHTRPAPSSPINNKSVRQSDYGQFLIKNCSSVINPGLIMTKDGKIIGQHQGIAFYTIGQRKGLGQLKIKEKKPYYVIKIDAQNNTLIVGEEKDLYSKECLVKDVNWISGQMPKLPIEIKVKIRYKHPAASAILNRLSPNIYIVKFKNSQRAITPGQSAVFYLKDEVLGGGVITD